MKNSSFNLRCYDLLSKVPAGRVTTYKNIAQALNCKAYRAVGNAMNRNPNAPQVPCHRVVCSDGGIGGYAYGLAAKRQILAQENIQVVDNKIANFEQVFFDLREIS